MLNGYMGINIILYGTFYFVLENKTKKEDNDYDDDDDSDQLFIIYVPSQQPQGQLQTQHSVDTGNYIIDKHNINSKTNNRQALEKKHINKESKQTRGN
jgi:hypothetical protein